MELYIWDGEKKWALPSMDLKSLQMMAYVKFSGAPVTVIRVGSPTYSPNSILPTFRCPEGMLTEFGQVTAYLRKQNYSCDFELSAKQCSEVIAYEYLLKEKLYPALIYLWWVEPKNYYDIIQKWYFSNIPFPYKFWYPQKFHKMGKEFINCLFDDPSDMQMIETDLHKQAQECLTILSNRLGEKEYYFGHSPSTLDAIIFPYLALLLKVDLKVTVLQNHIKACPNLSRYVSRILQRFFPSVVHAEEREKLKKPSKSSEKPSETDTLADDIPHKGHNLILSGLIAFTAMFGYAVAAGLVQVDMGNDASQDDYEYEYEYEEENSSSE